jgi:hypothetical protein
MNCGGVGPHVHLLLLLPLRQRRVLLLRWLRLRRRALLLVLLQRRRGIAAGALSADVARLLLLLPSQ